MKITKNQLRKIIREEKARLVKEQRGGRNEGLDILDELRMMGIPDSVLVDYLVGNWMSGDDAYQSMLDFRSNEISWKLRSANSEELSEKRKPDW